MKRIKLMADYYCSPLWHASDNEVGNIEPDDLALSESLKKELTDWADKYDETLNMDDPANSGFPTAEIEAEFKKEGERLKNKLQKELGEDYLIIYHP